MITWRAEIFRKGVFFYVPKNDLYGISIEFETIFTIVPFCFRSCICRAIFSQKRTKKIIIFTNLILSGLKHNVKMLAALQSAEQLTHRLWQFTDSRAAKNFASSISHLMINYTKIVTSNKQQYRCSSKCQRFEQ